MEGADLVDWKDSPSEFEKALCVAHIGVVAVRSLGKQEVGWLRVALARSDARPSCVAVTPLTIESVQRRRSRNACPFQVVWAEEVEARLRPILTNLNGKQWNPLRSAVEKMVDEYRPRAAVRRALESICGDPPPASVNQLAKSIFLAASTLRNYWKVDVPLRCGPKQLLKWSVLLWAIRRRLQGDSYRSISREAEVRQRTLRRYASELAGCGVVEAARKPDLVNVRFEAWWAEEVGGEPGWA